MKIGITLAALRPSLWTEATLLADELGFESVWMPEHLVIPVELEGSPIAGADHPPVPPDVPVFEVFSYLSFLAGQTERIRFGTYVYNIGLRHPLAVARAVAGGGSVLLLDEPAAGLGPADATALSDIIRRLAGDLGIAVLLIEHNVDMVLRTCDQIVALNFGEMIGHGTPAEIRKNPAVVAAYLGAGDGDDDTAPILAPTSTGPPSTQGNR